MIPVRIGMIDPDDQNMREAAEMLLPGYVFSEAGVRILGAVTEDGILAGALAVADITDADNEDDDIGMILRLLWIEVLPDYRREGIGVVLMGSLASDLAGADYPPELVVWYDDEDSSDAFDGFLEVSGLFDIEDDEVDGRPVHIALWNGETFESMEAEASE